MGVKLKYYWEALINSYGQIFFSNHKWFGYLLLLASLVNPSVGIAGLIAGAVAVITCDIMGFNETHIRSGLYSFNAIMVGFIIGLFYKLNLPSIGILILTSILTTFISIWLSAVFSAYAVPFLGIPFILGVWTVLMGVGAFKAVELSERGIYALNDMYSIWGPEWGKWMYELSQFKLPLLMDVYLKSLGAIFLQYNLLVGGIIAIGLLIYSRIAFTLSIIGFLVGYYFCLLFQGNMSELEYSYIGFNYILSSIALGGFFLIPSWKSYLLAVLSAVLIALSISALGSFFGTFGLPIYSLPFSMVVILILYILYQRQNHRGLQVVQHQLYGPEKNLYAHHHQAERYKNEQYFQLHLPYYGDWQVSQAHAGEITHKGDWQYAFDFVITDDTGKTFSSPGTEVSDFYCYNLPVLAPGDGTVVNVLDGVEDNAVGGVNLDDNWGNAVVIKHADYLYTKLTHLKPASLKVKVGDWVKKGQVLGSCGNSGRSPEPHIHFQVQSTPYIGAKTLKYPLAYYITKERIGHQFHAFEYPKKDQRISKVATTPLLLNAFDFIPGMTLRWEVEGKNEIFKWEVFTDAYNQTYIYCHQSKATAYFVNNGTLHYFTAFHGDKETLLHAFYLAAHKVLLGYYEGIEIKDILPLTEFYSGIERTVQDFIAPFNIYLGASFRGEFTGINDQMNPSIIDWSSTTSKEVGGKSQLVGEYQLVIGRKGIQSLTLNQQSKCIKASVLYD